MIKYLLLWFCCAGFLQAQSLDSSAIVYKLDKRPLILRFRSDLNWYSVTHSRATDSITLQRNYNSSAEIFPRQVQVTFPVTTEIKEVSACLQGRNPSDTSLPACLKGAAFLIGIKSAFRTGIVTNNTLAYDAAYLPFRNSLRVGAAFNLENEWHYVSLYALGNVYQKNPESPWMISGYSLHISGAEREVESGNYRFRFGNSILQSTDSTMHSADVPSVLWYGLLDNDLFPDFILEKGRHRNRSYILLLSSSYYKEND